MNQVIYKYILAITDRQEIEMPDIAELLTIQVQGGKVCLWAMVDIDAVPIKRVFEIFGTGNPIPEADGTRIYIGTYQLLGGQLVFHVFELTKGIEP